VAKKAEAFHFHPLTPKNWKDLANLFGPRGACAGCWCMYWRLGRSLWEKGKGDGNRRAFQRLVSSGAPTGVLAYHGDKPVGWCGVAPREHYPALSRSRILRPVDSAPVWSVTCFYVARGYRRSGLSAKLLTAAAGYAQSRNAAIVEGYPHDPRSEMADAFAWTGLLSVFRGAGFEEVARRSPTRPVMRLKLS
jgi:GNAT superfamily N-acetyltransferase